MRFLKTKWDRLLFLSFIIIASAGVFFIYSATWSPQLAGGRLNQYVIKQLIWIGSGLVIMLFISEIEYRKMLNIGYLLYFLNLLALIAVLFFAQERYGAKRWIDLGFFSFQPSEFVKITAILALASFLGEEKNAIGSLRHFSGAVALVLPSFLLIFLQPDLGTALVLVPITFSMLFIAGEKIKHMVGTVILGMSGIPVLWHFLKSYQKQRLLVFMNPDLDPLGAGYTIIQSRIAIGSGGFWGKGYLEGTQSYLRFLPERHTDFIFSVIGEQWGFAGASLLVLLFGLVIWRGLRIMRKSQDVYGRCIAAGVVSLIFFQVFVNITMTMGLMPVVGLPLPAVSYGGSSTITGFIGVGLLLSVSKKKI